MASLWRGTTLCTIRSGKGCNERIVSNRVPRPRGRPRSVAALKQAVINFVSTLPDGWLSDVLSAIGADPALTMVRVTRKDEGVGVCAGRSSAGAGNFFLVTFSAAAALRHQHTGAGVETTAGRPKELPRRQSRLFRSANPRDLPTPRGKKRAAPRHEDNVDLAASR